MILMSVSCSIMPMPCYLFNQFPTNGYPGYFQHFALMDSAATENPQKSFFCCPHAC